MISISVVYSFLFFFNVSKIDASLIKTTCIKTGCRTSSQRDLKPNRKVRDFKPNSYL